MTNHIRNWGEIVLAFIVTAASGLAGLVLLVTFFLFFTPPGWIILTILLLRHLGVI